jgi:hypothetical protein
MKLIPFLATVSAISAFGFAATAQDDAFVKETRCWLASKSFTPGATGPAGSGVMVCTKDGSWVQAAESASSSSCLYDGSLYGVGSVISVKDAPKDGQTLQCNANGTWKQ